MYEPEQFMQTDETALRDEMKKEKRRISALGWSFALFLLLPQLLVSAITIFVNEFFPTIANDLVFLNLSLYLLMYGVALPLALLILHPHGKEPLQQRSISFPIWLLFLLLSFGFTYIGSFIGDAILSFFEELGAQNALDTAISELPLSVLMLIALVAAPLGEEFVFRKLFIDRLHRYGTIAAVGISSICFALFHLNPYQFLYAFLFGCLLGYLYEKTGRLRYTIALHFAMNLIAGIFPTFCEWLLGDGWQELQTFENVLQLQGLLLLELFGLLIGIFVIATIVVFLILVLKKKIRVEKGSSIWSTSQKCKILFGNPGMIVATVVLLTLIVINFILTFS